jgi:hypothetical protein
MAAEWFCHGNDQVRAPSKQRDGSSDLLPVKQPF